MDTASDNIIPMRKHASNEKKWMRAKEAMEYFHVSRNTLDKIARECSAVGRFGEKIVIYDVRKIEKYIQV